MSIVGFFHYMHFFFLLLYLLKYDSKDENYYELLNAKKKLLNIRIETHLLSFLSKTRNKGIAGNKRV